MNPAELARLGYDVEGLVPDGDYVPTTHDEADGSIGTDLVMRGFEQLDQLNAIGGVSALGGSRERLEQIEAALDGGDLDLDQAVARYGSLDQQRRLLELKADGLVS